LFRDQEVGFVQMTGNGRFLSGLPEVGAGPRTGENTNRRKHK
jgi:hypothetical protein